MGFPDAVQFPQAAYSDIPQDIGNRAAFPDYVFYTVPVKHLSPPTGLIREKAEILPNVQWVPVFQTVLFLSVLPS